ncbi:MAG: hypothetical protein Q8903_04295 [Bacteroidota bacterium]|nr:hypothetical protein [Bacteroidota bacterium]
MHADKSLIIICFLVLVGSIFPQTKSLVNPKHLDDLYEEISVNNNNMAIIHIYADYPTYKWVDASGEGITCVDDVARASVFYMKYYNYTHDSVYLNKVKRLINFVLHMQSENGYFYNFMMADHSINKTYKTSIAEPNWWTWRAVWSLTFVQKYLTNDIELSNKINTSLEKSFTAIKKYLPLNSDKKSINGVLLPKWLPFETGADQSSILLIALSAYYENHKDQDVLPYINSLADGIMLMQVKDKSALINGAFLSWENTWHAWGNSQAYALLYAGSIINNKKYLKAAYNEINHFHKYLLSKQFPSSFELSYSDNKLNSYKESKYTQIAYGIRPLIYSNLKAYNITKNKKFAKQAKEIAGWFWGKNIKKQQMYFPESGICYDGLDEDRVNKNSGAESTIEGLLSLIELEQNNIFIKD